MQRPVAVDQREVVEEDATTVYGLGAYSGRGPSEVSLVEIGHESSGGGREPLAAE